MRTARRLLDVLERADLIGCTVALGMHVMARSAHPGQRTHLADGCINSDQRGPAISVPLGVYLTTAHLCPSCAVSVERRMRSQAGGEGIYALLAAHDDLTKIRQAATGPVDPVRVARLTRALAAHTGQARCFRIPELAGALAALDEAATQATAALRRAAALDTDAVLTAIRNSLVPARWRSAATFDHTSTLIGLAPAPALRDLALATIETFRIPGPDGAVLLRAPAYVADLLARHLGNRASGTYITTTTSTQHDATIIKIWNPSTGGPLANLALAACAAADLHGPTQR
jgi:hypothetical protein